MYLPNNCILCNEKLIINKYCDSLYQEMHAIVLECKSCENYKIELNHLCVSENLLFNNKNNKIEYLYNDSIYIIYLYSKDKNGHFPFEQTYCRMVSASKTGCLRITDTSKIYKFLALL